MKADPISNTSKKAQKAFVERGLASRAAAQETGKYVAAATVLGKLTERLVKARGQKTFGC